MLKTKNLSDVIVHIIMAIIYCSVAFYFMSIRTNLFQVAVTAISFILGALLYFKLSFKKPKNSEV